MTPQHSRLSSLWNHYPETADASNFGGKIFRMTILVDAHLVENHLTGIGRYLTKLLEQFVRLNHDFVFQVLIQGDLSSNHMLRRLECSKLRLVPTRLHGVSLSNLWKAQSYVQEIEPQVYHHPHFDLPWRMRCKTVITLTSRSRILGGYSPKIQLHFDPSCTWPELQRLSG